MPTVPSPSKSGGQPGSVHHQSVYAAAPHSGQASWSASNGLLGLRWLANGSRG